MQGGSILRASPVLESGGIILYRVPPARRLGRLTRAYRGTFEGCAYVGARYGAVRQWEARWQPRRLWERLCLRCEDRELRTAATAPQAMDRVCQVAELSNVVATDAKLGMKSPKGKAPFGAFR